MEAIAGLRPETLWMYFWKISQIPRESKKEARIRNYIMGIAEKFALEYKTDEVGNVLVSKPGVADKPTIIIQSHMDMVCEKDKETIHNFDTDPIKLVREGRWIRAEGTTLGADNGIGLAAMLALMENSSFIHPPLELLFTVDEETGLTGASMLEPGFADGNLLLNLDSEEGGTLYIGCAGGRNTEICMDIECMHPPGDYRPLLVRVTGLKGGHSGINIHQGLGNAIKLLNRFLWNTAQRMDLYLSWFEGGSKHNAIPREAQALIYIDPAEMDIFKRSVDEYNTIFTTELKGIDDKVTIAASEDIKTHVMVLTKEDSLALFNLIYSFPHGVVRMSNTMKDAVETSTNLAICSIRGGKATISTNQRSLFASAIKDISDQVKSIGLLSGFRVYQEGDYPAWKPDINSHILKICKGVYKSLYGKSPKIKVIHAGLECGIIGKRYPGLDMISFGPSIENAHSPSERVNINSVEEFWNYLTHILEYPAKN
ncbi:MAG: aminoacyl-histidine dipeptidase [Thermodesulfobacteriota bacterium]|nr:aminoacyl-histidine dipeptidase [Thermodesulfobacteriota bacterium]